MRITRRDRKVIFVMSGDGSTCPRMSLINNSVKLRDDYKDSFKTGTRLIKKILQIG